LFQRNARDPRLKALRTAHTPVTSPPELEAAKQILRPYLRRSLFFAAIASLLSLSPTFYMLVTYDRVVNSRSYETLLMLTVLILGVYVVMEILEWVRSRIMLEGGRRMDAHLTPRVFSAVFEGHLKRNLVGGAQALTDLRTVREFLQAPAMVAFMEAPLSLLVLAIIFLISPLLGWCALAGGVLQLIVSVLTERRTQPPLVEANKASNAAQQYANTSLQNAQVIESMGMLPGIHARWMVNQRKFLSLQAQASDAAGGLSALAKSIQLLQGSILLGLGAWLMMQGTLTGEGGLIIVASISGGKALQPAVALISQWKSVVMARDAWQRLGNLLRELPAAPPRMTLPAPEGRLAVEAVTASPPGSQVPVLRNVSFALQAGECLAIIGPSGSGKTCLARLLMGIWPAGVGKVRLDGSDVHVWNKAELGPHVGYLPQGIELFDGTLAENIARFGEVDMAKVEAAAQLAGLGNVVEGLAQGYDSRIGDEGAFLSGGQRQRVGLARAIYGEPRFVVLDEPNSSLDEQGDAALLHLLKTLKARGTTLVIITHRANVLEVADRILVLVEGAVSAFGPRDEIIEALRTPRGAQANPAATGARPLAAIPPPRTA